MSDMLPKSRAISARKMAKEKAAAIPGTGEWLRYYARRHDKVCIDRLAHIVRTGEPREACVAISMLLERGHGKPAIMTLDPNDPDSMPAQLGYVLIPGKAEGE